MCKGRLFSICCGFRHDCSVRSLVLLVLFLFICALTLYERGSGIHIHGWEIAVILRNFRKTKLSKSNFFFFFFLNSISTCTQCATRRLSLCDIRKYRFPAFYGTSPAKPPSSFAHAWYKQAWNSSRKRGFSRKWKLKMAENFFFRGKQIHKHTLFFKQSVGVAESMEITRERMRVWQQNRALMELSFVDICIFQAISVTKVYGRSWLV